MRTEEEIRAEIIRCYKEYKRKEQECEELKKIINEAKNSKLDLNSFFAIEATVGEYQLELDQLKKENDELKNLNTRLDNQRETYWKECKKLKKTLTEIKEIAESAYCLTNATNKDMAQFAKQILQKISECEGNDG